MDRRRPSSLLMTGAADPPSVQRRSRLRWWHAPVVLVLLFLLLALAFVVRIHFEWDLIGFRQKAAEHGIELDPEKALPPVDGRAVALLDEWGALFDTGFSSFKGRDSDGAWHPPPRPALPLHDAAAAHYQHITAAQWQTFDHLLDDSCDIDPFTVFRPQHFKDHNPDSGDAYQFAIEIAKIEGARLRQCPDAQVAALSVRLLRWIDAQPITGILDIYLKQFYVAQLQESLSLRLDDCRQQQATARNLAASLRRQAEHIQDDFTIATEHDLGLIHALLTDKKELQEYGDSKNWRRLLTLPAARATRQAFCQNELDLLLTCRRINDWPTFYKLLLHRQQPEWRPDDWRGALPNAANFAELTFSTNLKVVLRLMTRLRLGNQLLAAELLDEPWPVDCCDPVKQPLRPLQIDGRLIAAYSVGLDGVDDGGDDDTDLVFWLHGHRDENGRVNWADEDPAVIYAAESEP